MSKTIPNDGKIDIFSSNWSIYRLLRSVDYKPFDIFPALKIEVKDQIYKVEKYKYEAHDPVEVSSRLGFLSDEEIVLCSPESRLILTVKK